MFKRFQELLSEKLTAWRQRRQKKKAYRKAQREWEARFPPLSCHLPYVSPEELEELRQMVEEHRAQLEKEA